MLVKQQQWLDSLSLPEAYRTPINDAYPSAGHHLRQAPVVKTFCHRWSSMNRSPLITWDAYSSRTTSPVNWNWKLRKPDRFLSNRPHPSHPVVHGRRLSTICPAHQCRPAVLREIYRNTISELARHCSAQGLITEGLGAAVPGHGRRDSRLYAAGAQQCRLQHAAGSSAPGRHVFYSGYRQQRHRFQRITGCWRPMKPFPAITCWTPAAGATSDRFGVISSFRFSMKAGPALRKSSCSRRDFSPDRWTVC